MTEKEACKFWTSRNLVSIPTAVVNKLVKYSDYTDIAEVTQYSEGEELPDNRLPFWSTMWAFKDYACDNWLKNHDGIKAMSDIGFRIYKSEDYVYIFGIDNGGRDFYDDYWLPLYRALGLHWHDEPNDDEPEPIPLSKYLTI